MGLNVFAVCRVLSNVVSFRSKNCKNHIRVDGSSFYNTIQYNTAERAALGVNITPVLTPEPIIRGGRARR